MTPSTVCVFPGTNVSLYCALPESSIIWRNAEFGEKLISVDQTRANLGRHIQLYFVSVYYNQDTREMCTFSNATINNFPKSLDGLSITCEANAPNSKNSLQVFMTISAIGKTNHLVCLYSSFSTMANCFREPGY